MNQIVLLGSFVLGHSREEKRFIRRTPQKGRIKCQWNFWKKISSKKNEKVLLLFLIPFSFFFSYSLFLFFFSFIVFFLEFVTPFLSFEWLGNHKNFSKMWRKSFNKRFRRKTSYSSYNQWKHYFFGSLVERNKKTHFDFVICKRFKWKCKISSNLLLQTSTRNHQDYF